MKADKEKGHVVLPGDAAEGGQVGNGEHVAVAVFCVGHLELVQVRLVVHVPAEDDGAEAEAVRGDGQELFLGHELAAQDAVDVEAGQLDAIVVLEEPREGVDGDFLGSHGCVC